MSKTSEWALEEEHKINIQLDRLYRDIERDDARRKHEAIINPRQQEIMMDNHINPNPLER